MARLIAFLVFISAVFLVLFINSYKNAPLNSTDFNFKAREQKVSDTKKIAEQFALAAAKSEAGEVVEAPTAAIDVEAIKRGETLFQNSCVTCHGEKGEGNKAEEGPMLAGQHGWYIESQLLAFQKKERINEKMDPFIKNLTDKDFKDLAAYVATFPCE